MTTRYHQPVMVSEVLDRLRPEDGGLYFDGTVGGGGHAEALLVRGSTARVLGVDRDPEAVREARARLARFGERARVVEGDYADVAEGLAAERAPNGAVRKGEGDGAVRERGADGAARERRLDGAARERGPKGAVRELASDRAVRARAGKEDARAEGRVPGEALAGALLDLGISSRQIDAPERGFSFRPGTPLDMRMATPAAGGAGGPTAADLLNSLPEEDLAEIFRSFGEEPRARRLAREVVRRRGERPFAESDDLLAAMDAALGPRCTPQDRARIFQALRIAVNGELDSLERALPALREALGPGGVFVVLSYHSLEDRRVKNAFREWSRTCVCPPELPVCVCRGAPLGEVLTRKPVEASAEEVAANPRARSARLRAWRKAA